MGPQLKFFRLPGSCSDQDLKLIDQSIDVAQSNKIDVITISDPKIVKTLLAEDAVVDQTIFVYCPFEGEEYLFTRRKILNYFFLISSFLWKLISIRNTLLNTSIIIHNRVIFESIKMQSTTFLVCVNKLISAVFMVKTGDESLPNSMCEIYTRFHGDSFPEFCEIFDSHKIFLRFWTILSHR